jgi:hypothetical protein
MAPPRLSAMWMLLSFEFNRNGNKASVTHTSLGDDMLSEVPDIAHRAPEHRYLARSQQSCHQPPFEASGRA